MTSFNDIIAAAERIKPFIHRTPVLGSTQINQITAATIFFKCENFQKVGAFKMRGASNAIAMLNNHQLDKGVATHSSGNFAQALALAAKLRGIPAYIVMPENSSQVKFNAVRSYNGNIIPCKPNLQARESTLNEIVQKTGATFLHPYNNHNVIAGQGTATLELLSEINNLDMIIAPLGGGGLLSGTLIAAKGFNDKIIVYGAEPIAADDGFRSFKAGKIIPSVNPNTIADGLLTSLGDLTFPIIQKYCDDILTVDENSIISAMKLIWERMKIIIEPSSAVPLAAVMENPDLFKDKTIGIIISGGNVDLQKLPF
ncbi:MAG: pyridoxal-phosphate dependent enzyme [Candidatus Kapabacteria bacterium]|nr:pyridoxal-phosphate dependent enzyme [Candidatus Kapabacteria bacterium]